MSTFKASGKHSRLCDVYSKMDTDPDFKMAVDLIIDKHEPGFSLLRLLRLDTNNIQTPGRLLQALVDRYDLDKHCFIINDNVLNITLEDVLYITGLPINGKAVISETSRDKDAFTRAFGNFPEGKVHTGTLERVALDKSRPNEQRLQALLLLVIVCFVSPVCEDYEVHGYLVQFVTDMAKVDSYSWGAAFLASLYVGIEKYKSKLIKKSTVDGNCWPLLVFFCIRIPKLCKELGFSINLEEQKAPLLSHCMKLMKKTVNNKILPAASLVETAFSDLKREDINWHVYDKTMLDERMLVDHLQHVTCHAPMIFMYLVAHHRPIFHLRQFQGLDKYVDMVKSVRLPAKKITLKENSGDTNQNLTKSYKDWIDLWENRKSVVDYIRGGNNTDDNSEEESSYNSDGDSCNSDGDVGGDNEEDVGGQSENTPIRKNSVENNEEESEQFSEPFRFFNDGEEDVGGDKSNKDSVENSGFRSPRTPEYKSITELIRMTDGPSFHVEGYPLNAAEYRRRRQVYRPPIDLPSQVYRLRLCVIWKAR